MTAREFLYQYRDADRKARRLKREYERELELIDAIRSAADIDGMPHGNGIRKPVEDKAIRLADKAAAWKIAELEAIEARQVVFDAIRNIKGDEGELLYLRYVELMRWVDVAKKLSCSDRTVHRVHARALRMIEKSCHCMAHSVSV